MGKSGTTRLAPAEQNEFDDSDQPQVVRLDGAAQALIGSQLKAMYAEICNEPVPKDLLDLLAQLERKDAGK